MKEEKYFLFFILLIVSLSFCLSLTPYDANSYVSVYSNVNVSSKFPNLVVSVLKYNPYPVEAGKWFDLWIKVQNTGEIDANHAIFELKTDYPFSSNDTLIRDYGLIYGRANSYKVDQTYDSSEVILKFRVKTEENSPSGISNLKLVVQPNGNDSLGATYDLPVEIYSLSYNLNNIPNSNYESPYTKWIYAIGGFVGGIFLIIALTLIRQKVKSSKKLG